MKQVLQVLTFDIASKFILGVLSILYIRVMDSSEFSQYVLAFSIAILLGQVFSSSFNRIYVLGFKQLSLDGKLGSFLIIQTLLVIIACGITLPFINLPSNILISISFFSIAFTLFEASKTIYQQKQRFIKYSAIELTRAFVICFLISCFIWAMQGKLNAWQALTAHALGMITVFLIVILLITINKHINKISENNSSILFRNIIFGPYQYLFGYFVLISIFTQLDVLMLWFIGTKFELAKYGSAFRYYGLLSMALGAVHVVLLPAIQNAEYGTELKIIFSSHRNIILLFIPILIAGAISANYFMPWVDTGKYPGAVIVFQILCISALISIAFSPHVNLLMRIGKFKFLFVLICIATILNFILNSILIPNFGAIGAAIATGLSSATVTIPIYLQSKNTLRIIGARKNRNTHLI